MKVQNAADVSLVIFLSVPVQILFFRNVSIQFLEFDARSFVRQSKLKNLIIKIRISSIVIGLKDPIFSQFT